MKRTNVLFGLLAGLALLWSAERARAQLPSTPTFIKSVSSGKVLDNPGWSQNNGTLIQQWDLNGGTNQQWRFVNLYNGYYAIQNVASGKYLTIPGLSRNNGTPIQQYQWIGGWSQQWGVGILEKRALTPGTFYRVKIYVWNNVDYKYLYVPGNSMNIGTIIQQYFLTGETSQEFWIGPL